MRNPKRIYEFMSILTELWAMAPDWRFGQIIENFFGFVKDEDKRDVYYIEDEEMLNLLKQYYEYLKTH